VLAAFFALVLTPGGEHISSFVNGSGQPIRLLGVNHTSSEYACVDGFGYNDGHMDAAAVASWNANAVRIPLNEDCWLS
jgi:endoglucanase